MASRDELIQKLKKQDLIDRLNAQDAAESQADAPSSLEVGARGAIQGAYPFIDETVGAARGLYDVATGPETMSDLPQQYVKRRDEYRSQDKAAYEQNPALYIGSQVAGGVGSAALTGGLAAGVRGAALMGMAQGLGSSEADLTKGDFEGASKDALISGAVGGGIQGGLTAIPYVAKRIPGLLGGPSASQIDDYIRNWRGIKDLGDDVPEAISAVKGEIDEAASPLFNAENAAKEAIGEAKQGVKSAKGGLDIAYETAKQKAKIAIDPKSASDAIKQNLELSGGKISQSSNELFDIAKKSGAFIKRSVVEDELANSVSKLMNDGVPPLPGTQAEKAMNKLLSLTSAVKQFPDDIDPYQTKKLLSQIYDLAEQAGSYEAKAAGQYTEVGKKTLKGVAGKLRESLGQNVPGYDEIAKKVSSGIKVQDALGDIFGTTEDGIRALQKVANGSPESYAIKEAAKAYDAINGTDISGIISKYGDDVAKFKGLTPQQLPEYGALKNAEQTLAGAQSDLASNQAWTEPLNRLSPGRSENAIRSMSFGKNLEGQESLKYLDEMAGTNLSQKVKDIGTLRAMTQGKPMGSAYVNAGMAAGRAAGGALLGYNQGGDLYSAGLGAAAGLASPKYVPQITKIAVDLVRNNSKWAGPLSQALARGDAAVATTHFLLSQQDPEYRQATQEPKEKP